MLHHNIVPTPTQLSCCHVVMLSWIPPFCHGLATARQLLGFYESEKSSLSEELTKVLNTAIPGNTEIPDPSQGTQSIQYDPSTADPLPAESCN